MWRRQALVGMPSTGGSSIRHARADRQGSVLGVPAPRGAGGGKIAPRGVAGVARTCMWFQKFRPLGTGVGKAAEAPSMQHACNMALKVTLYQWLNTCTTD